MELSYYKAVVISCSLEKANPMMPSISLTQEVQHHPPVQAQIDHKRNCKPVKAQASILRTGMGDRPVSFVGVMAVVFSPPRMWLWRSLKSLADAMVLYSQECGQSC